MWKEHVVTADPPGDLGSPEELGKSLLRWMGCYCSSSSASSGPSASSSPSTSASRQLSAYRRFLKGTLNLQVNHGNLARVSDRLLAAFYRLDRPKSAPRFFDFHRRLNIAWVERIWQRRIVILHPWERRGRPVQWVKYHDNRVRDLVSGRDKPVDYFVLHPASKAAQIYPVNNVYGRCISYGTEDELSKSQIVSSCMSDGRFCYLTGLRKLFSRQSVADCSHGSWCRSLQTLQASCRQVAADLGLGFILAHHVKSDILANDWKRPHPKHQSFSVVCVAPLAGDRVEDLPVVCVTLDGDLYLPHDGYARDIRKPPPRIANLPSASLPFAETCSQPEEDPPPPPPPEVSGETPEDYTCRCEHCEAMKERYGKNMEVGGSQSLIKNKTSSFDLLRTLGWFNPELEETLNKCCRLSIAAFDIETMSEKNPAHCEREENFLDLEDHLGGEDLLRDGHEPAEVWAVHTPVKIGVLDATMLENMENSVILTLEEETGTEALVKDFVHLLLDMREEALHQKRELLQDVFDRIEKYREAHFEFMERVVLPSHEPILKKPASGETPGMQEVRKQQEKSYEEKVSSVDKAWKHSVFGQLEGKLDSLCQSYNVFSHNGMSFDMVLVVGHMATAAKEMGLSFSMKKSGNRVRKIVLDSIHLLDSMPLVGAGTSLKALANMCGVRGVEKGRFPFQYFDRLDVLKETSLPEELDDWKSSLGNSPTREEIDCELENFINLNFKNIGEHLDHYLAADTELLLKSLLALNTKFYDILKINFVDSRNFTISSYASAGLQRELFKDLRIGFFAVNCAKTYGLLRRGMLGGLSACYRGVAGKDADMTNYVKLAEEMGTKVPEGLTMEQYLRGCNTHLLEDPTKAEPGNYVAYCDIAALYASGK